MFTYEKKDTTLGLILEDVASKIGDKAFLQFEEGKEVSYREVNETANRIGNRLTELGVKTGDMASLFCSNSLEFLYAWFGANKIGAAEASVNTAYKGDFLSYTLNDSGSEVLVVDEELVPQVQKVEGELKRVKHVVIIPSDPKRREKPEWRFQTLWFEDLCDGPASLPVAAAEVKHKTIAMCSYTSGTTGPSKGVLLTHYYLYTMAFDSVKLAAMGPDDISLVCLPFFHGNSKVMGVYPAILSGSKVVVYPRFSAGNFWDWVRKNKVTRTNMIGVLMPFLLGQPEQADDGDNPLEICQLVPNPPGMTENFLERFKMKGYWSAYGQSETNIIVVKGWDEKVPPGSPGRVNQKRFEVKIFDENDEEVPLGTQGEIVVRPKEPYTIMMGYHNKPETTAEAFRNAWFHSGDGGRFDEDGYFYFTDRIKDYIRRRGENISSMEVENVIMSHSGVKEAAAVGVTAYAGLEEEVLVYVVLNEGKRLDPREIIQWCEERMPYYAIPRYIELVDELPKTPSEKVQKYKLKKEGVGEKTWDREKAGYEVRR